jgi:diguanylate cyclase
MVWRATANRTGWAAWTVAVGGVALAVGSAAGALPSTTVTSVVSLGALLSLVVGALVHRPTPRWPWWLFCASGVLFIGAAMAREAMHSIGDLTAQRPLIPDMLALPGYACFLAALSALLHHRRGGGRDRGVFIDVLLLGLGTALVAWAFVLQPLIGRDGAAVVARVSIGAAAPLSLCLVALAARLAFMPGPRQASRTLLLFAMSMMLAGDTAYIFVETGRVHWSQGVLDLPYAIAYALMGAAALHPSMRHITDPIKGRSPHFGAWRLGLVACALVVPAGMLAVWSPSDPADRIITASFTIVLSALAAARVVWAVRAQAHSEVRLAHRATHDDLTGLPNRTLVLAHTDSLIGVARETGGTVTLLFVDVDQFKLVNDSLGHDIGDRLLIAISRRLRQLAPTRALVGRLSGDEFVVVVTGLDREGAAAEAERIREGFGQPLRLPHGAEMYASISVGVTVATPSEGPVDAIDLVRDADTAMYRSKESGRNAVTVFDVTMREGVARRLHIESELRDALANSGAAARSDRTGQGLVVHYQPVVALPSGRVRGFEALVRWPGAPGGIGPAEFVPVAEESGLVVPLGRFVLDEACHQLAQWRADLPGCDGLHMAVNVSARQLREGDLVGEVEALLDECDLPASALCLEITEGVVLADTPETAAALRGLRALGVDLAVDDFGTGFSSLSYLKRHPVTQLKVDRSFVIGLGSAGSDRSLVAAIIAMAHALGLDVVAEGVELAEQALDLVALGCGNAQGYLFSRPVPAAEIPGRLAELGTVESHDGELVPASAE